ncbi:hypothetical protein [Pseudooceanicola sp. MF1-13]|uniref:hypothetical protein n=1 Tax=Pseudooceanicola sp. MF1-13 TaxID=3379095 RepID=UPI00389196CE
MKTEKQLGNSIIEMISEKYSLIFIPVENLAIQFGFETDEAGLAKFKRWTSRVGIRPAPMRPGFYDPKAVRERLDAFHQTTPANDNVPEPSPDAPVDHVANRRLRNAKKGK